jgi:hypothetical protein
MKEEEKQEKKQEDLPLASMMIELYQKQVKDLEITKEKLEKANKRISLILLVMIVLFAMETTYIIACWDYLHPEAGIIHRSE